MISFINNARREGVPAEEAVVQGARTRLRAICLTSLTTIAGLLPMSMGLGGMSLTWGPFANTIVWGLAVGTLLTLFLIPSLYMFIVYDVAERRARKRRAAADAAGAPDGP
jgi:multidrug efflux pump subunit AcrB